MKTTHTHTGNCQACGRRQAIDNVKGSIAKHGYTVNWGFFNGVCGGSDHLPAQNSVDLTRQVIQMCTLAATAHDNDADALEAGKVDPKNVTRWDPTKEVTSKRGWVSHGAYVELPYAQGTTDEQDKARSGAVNFHRHHAEGNRSHAAFLTNSVLPMLGTELHTADSIAREVATAKAEKAARPTKGKFKAQLDGLNAKYHKLRVQLHDAYLERDRDERHSDEKATNLYYGANDLHQWNAKWAKIALDKYPQLADTINQMTALRAALVRYRLRKPPSETVTQC